MSKNRERKTLWSFCWAAIFGNMVVVAAEAQTVTRASVHSSGQQSNYHSVQASISPDGRHVVFESPASNLVDGDTNGFQDIFVHDRQTGKTARLSVSSPPNPKQADNASYFAAISANNRYVVFESDATNLVVGDSNGYRDIFLHDRDPNGDGLYDEGNGITLRVSFNSSFAQPNNYCFRPSVSGDGRYVTFHSHASNLVLNDNNGTSDVFVRDTHMGTTRCVSVDSSGNQANGPSSDAVISPNGRYVVFQSGANNLVPGDTNGASDIFVHDRDADGNGIFDEVGGIATTRVSVDSSGAQANWFSIAAHLSADARYVTFESHAGNLVPNDNNAARDIFAHDRQTGKTVRVSVASDGSEGNSHSLDARISPCGRFVAFASDADNLVLYDLNLQPDVFVHDRDPDGNGILDQGNGITRRESLSAQGIEGNSFSGVPSIAQGGRFLAFESGANHLLLSDDTNFATDIFVRDRILLEFNGRPRAGERVHYTLLNAFSEEGNLMQVVLSSLGTSPGIPLPGGLVLPLIPDVCTTLSLSFPIVFRGIINANGVTNTFPVILPNGIPPGLTVYSAALTLDLAPFQFRSVTGPIGFVTLP